MIWHFRRADLRSIPKLCESGLALGKRLWISGHFMGKEISTSTERRSRNIGRARPSATIGIKRVYEPSSRRDGRRILVERLWPRGIKKDSLEADAWMKEVAPSTALRKWYDHRVERWEKFRQRYRDELDANPGAWAPILSAAKRGTVTLLYSAHDTVHNGAAVFCEYLIERAAGPAHRSIRRGARG